jgi:hypothetical protein
MHLLQLREMCLSDPGPGIMQLGATVHCTAGNQLIICESWSPALVERVCLLPLVSKEACPEASQGTLGPKPAIVRWLECIMPVGKYMFGQLYGGGSVLFCLSAAKGR